MTELITDRTEADVLLGNSKGVYSAADLNRVESAVSELLSLAVDLDIYPELKVKTDWAFANSFSSDDWPTESNMKRYVKNVIELCRLFEVDSSSVPQSMNDLTWSGANAIEDSLKRVYSVINGILETLRYSGEIYAGEEISI